MSSSQPAEQGTRHPRVSIVVPVYNVEAFLDEALESIRDQDETGLEIVCIDDGSTDGSAGILAQHAQEDRRIVIHHQRNSGLGAARNVGLALATGEFVMFTDSDDRLPIGAVSALLGSLDRTNSDFAVGKVRRFDEERRWRSALTTPVFNFQIDRTHLTETPQLVYDTIAVNKLFRKSFLDRLSFEFPEGVAFEDMALIARAHLEAEHVDVVPHWVYEWREREGSITADRFNPASFSDRVMALQSIRTMVVESGSAAVLHSFLAKLVGFDQMIYARAIDPDNRDQVRAFADGYGSLYRSWPEGALETVSSEFPQAIAAAARSGDLDALEPLLRLASPTPTISQFSTAFSHFPRLTIRKMSALAKRRTQAARRTAREALNPLKKEALPRVLSGAGTALALTTENQLTNRLRPSLVDPVRDGRAWLVEHSLIRGHNGNAIRRGTFDLGARRVLTGYNSKGWLTARIRPVSVRVVPISLDEQWVEVSLEDANDVGQMRLRANGSGRLIPGQPAADGVWRFPVADIPKGTESNWRFEHLHDGSWKRADGAFVFPTLTQRVESRLLELSPRVDGHLNLTARPALPVVHADLTPDLRLLVRPHPSVSGIRLRHLGLKTDVSATLRTDGSWELDIERTQRFGKPAPLRTGTWAVQGLVDGVWSPLTSTETTEREWEDHAAGTRLSLTFDQTRMRISVRAAYAPDERGKWNQAALGKAVPRQMRTSPLRPQVIYECFYGKQVSCHPRALFDELSDELPDWEHLWVVSPGMTYAPEGTTPVIRWTRDWYERMADSQVIVSNCGLAPYLRRREGQVILQTWHGTPLKRIGLDMITFDHFRGGYVRETQIQSEQWTHLISPSPFCSEVFPRAFGFKNNLLEIGSPRNDRLLTVDPKEVSAIRSRLGLDSTQRAVLIAPTWRDNQRKRSGWHATIGFNPIRLIEALPDDVVILFRAHSNVGSLSDLVEHPRFVNVSDYPDVQDLYLVADAMSTDYSSVMFDYSTLNRPMAFFCPDLDEYRDELRGFYFDFEAEAPGPISLNERAFTDDLARLIDHGLTDAEQQRLDRFRHRYTGLEDGKATDRAVRSILDAVSAFD